MRISIAGMLISVSDSALNTMNKAEFLGVVTPQFKGHKQEGDIRAALAKAWDDANGVPAVAPDDAKAEEKPKSAKK